MIRVTRRIGNTVLAPSSSATSTLEVDDRRATVEHRRNTLVVSYINRKNGDRYKHFIPMASVVTWSDSDDG